MADFRQSRRSFFKALGVGAALAALGRFLVPRQPASRQLLRVPVADLPAHGALVYREARVVLLRADQSFLALSLVCTHLGCTVTVTPTELVCPCHGSRFDRHGAVLTGPAPKPLARLRVVERQGMLEIYPEEGSSHG